MDYVNRLSREQRDQYAPLSDKRRLPNTNIPAQPRRDEHQGHEQPGRTGAKRKADSQFPTSDKPVKRHRSSAKPTVSPSSTDGILASSSQGHARGDTPAIQGDEGPPPVDAEQNRSAVEHLLDCCIRSLHGRNWQVIPRPIGGVWAEQR